VRPQLDIDKEKTRFEKPRFMYYDINMKQITTTSEKQTFAFAKKFAKSLKGGEVIGLIGELGTGKTIFTKGLAKGLGVKGIVNSPTFVLMKIYEVKGLNLKIKVLCHIDAYRIKLAKDLSAVGIEEYFNRTDTITVVEWADKIKKILPKRTRYVKFINRGENKRLIIF